MEINIGIEELRKRSIFIGTPMYGGMCSGVYTKSLSDFSIKAAKYGLDFRCFFLFNESLITRARNYIVDEFLRSGYSHLMFIDADIGFSADDVLALAALCDPESEYDIMCGPYPKKTISWEKIKAAVDQGMADEDPRKLEKYVGDYVFNPAKGQREIGLNEPVEVLEGGTGFMMIQRHTFEKFAEVYPEYSYKPDHVRTEHFDGSREIHAYFDTVIDPDQNRYLSEDYMFCQWSRKAGLKTWMCPWMRLYHMGTYNFGGSLADIASIGASPTADISKLNKDKKK